MLEPSGKLHQLLHKVAGTTFIDGKITPEGRIIGRHDLLVSEAIMLDPDCRRWKALGVTGRAIFAIEAATWEGDALSLMKAVHIILDADTE